MSSLLFIEPARAIGGNPCECIECPAIFFTRGTGKAGIAQNALRNARTAGRVAQAQRHQRIGVHPSRHRQGIEDGRMNQSEADYYRVVGYFRASGLPEAQAHYWAEEAMDRTLGLNEWIMQNLVTQALAEEAQATILRDNTWALPRQPSNGNVGSGGSFI